MIELQREKRIQIERGIEKREGEQVVGITSFLLLLSLRSRSPIDVRVTACNDSDH